MAVFRSISKQVFCLCALSGTNAARVKCRCSCCLQMQYWRRQLWARSYHLGTAECQSTTPTTGLLSFPCFRLQCPLRSVPNHAMTAVCKACKVAFMCRWLQMCGAHIDVSGISTVYWPPPAPTHREAPSPPHPQGGPVLILNGTHANPP